MMQNVVFKMGMILGLILPNGAQAALEKASLKEFCLKMKQNEEISALFKASANLESSPEKNLKPLLKKNQKTQKQLLEIFDQSGSFARGEIEDEKTLSCTIQRLQLSLLESREAAFKKDWKRLQKNFQSWFLFAADFPYEESSLVGLRFTGVVRALLLDELEALQKKFSAEIAGQPAMRDWFLNVRAPWPVDRVLVTEAKRLLNPAMMPVAQAAASSYQKNPYQTSEQALKRVKGGEAQEADLLKQMWRDSDIQQMKTEMNRIGRLKIALAQAEYLKMHGKSPSQVSDLVQAKLLVTAPMDYFTGTALGLTSP